MSNLPCRWIRRLRKAPRLRHGALTGAGEEAARAIEEAAPVGKGGR